MAGGDDSSALSAATPAFTPTPGAIEATAHTKITVEVPHGEHELESAWTFWYDAKKPRTKPDAEGSEDTGAGTAAHSTDVADYAERLKPIGSFKSIEGFWRYYSHIARAKDLPGESSIMLFRDRVIPAWESFPNGGCWIVKVRKQSGALSGMWEKLCFAAIGELFQEQGVAGVVVSIRKQEDLLSVWNRDNSHAGARLRIGDKLRSLLQLKHSAGIEYKNHFASMKDGSTFTNASAFQIHRSKTSTGEQLIATPIIPRKSKAGSLKAKAAEAGAAIKSPKQHAKSLGDAKTSDGKSPKPTAKATPKSPKPASKSPKATPKSPKPASKSPKPATKGEAGGKKTAKSPRPDAKKAADTKTADAKSSADAKTADASA